MQRSNTIKELYEKVLAMFPHLNESLPDELVVEGDPAAVDYSDTVPEIK